MRPPTDLRGPRDREDDPLLGQQEARRTANHLPLSGRESVPLRQMWGTSSPDATPNAPAQPPGGYMLLFDDIDRTYLRPAAHVDTNYTYLNRSGRPAARKVREQLESWWARYPEEHRAEHRRRFETHFASAFYELLLHELMLKLGYELEIHPELPGTDKRPDFLVSGADQRFYLEAVVSSEGSQEREAKEALLESYYDEINKTTSPNFFIRLTRVEIPGTEQPSGRRIRAFLERELARLDPDELGNRLEAEGFDGLPLLEFRDGDVRVDVHPIPKSPGLRGKSDVRPIGIYPIESKIGGEAPSLRSTLFSKAGRYGTPDMPFVIAVNWTGWPLDQIEVMQTLFGTEQFVLRQGREPEMTRAPDGLFYGPDGPQYTRVSAVAVTSITPWTLGEARLQLVHNPWAAKPLSSGTLPFDERAPQDGRMLLVTGKRVGEYLGIPSGWPLDEESGAIEL